MNGYLGVEQLTNLQTLALQGELVGGRWPGKINPTSEFVFRWVVDSLFEEGVFESITKLTALQTLTLRTKNYSKKRLLNDLGLDVIEEETLFPGLEPFSSHAYLYVVYLGGKLEKLPKQFEFYPPNLLKLILWGCELRDDPMMILEKLPSLRMLGLCFDAYVGKKMMCSSGGFLQLESLLLTTLNELEELTVEEGAMSSLKTLEILSCDKMKKLPHGLLQLTNLERLSLRGSSCHESIEEIEKAGGEDWNKLL